MMTIQIIADHVTKIHNRNANTHKKTDKLDHWEADDYLKL